MPAEMDEEKYFEERLDNQIQWYDKKSVQLQKSFKRLRTLEIVLAASIPFLVGYTEGHPAVLFAVGAIGVAVACLAAVLALQKYEELWTRYRSTCETLTRHKYLYVTQAPPYESRPAFTKLVANVESLMAEERSDWLELQREKPPEMPSTTEGGPRPDEAEDSGPS